jgi:hypothetical protein
MLLLYPLHEIMSAGFFTVAPENLAQEDSEMYRKTNDGHLVIYDLILPFGGHLKEDNR